jgi:cardiolipin synthase
VAQHTLTKRRLFGLDRSGPPPEATRPDAPWRPWTIPNAIGYVRAALIPVFLVLVYQTPDGIDALAATLYFISGVTDYADGIAARITGQYSRLGALLDPLIDRALVVSGVVVCWSYDLLPRWAIVALLAREVLMLAVGPVWVKKGLELRINWPGRIAVGPTMLGVFLGLTGARTVGEGFLCAGLGLGWVATVLYFRDGMRQLEARRAGPGAEPPEPSEQPPPAAGPVL